MSVNAILVSLLIVAAGGVGGYLLYHSFQWLAAQGDRGRYRIDGLVLRVLGPPVSLMVALVSVNYALYRLPAVREQFGAWDGAQRALLILTGTWILASLVKNLIREYGLPLAERTDTDLDERCGAATNDLVRSLVTRPSDDDVAATLADTKRYLLTVRDLERAGDHAVNIAARTLYMLENDAALIY